MKKKPIYLWVLLILSALISVNVSVWNFESLT